MTKQHPIPLRVETELFIPASALSLPELQAPLVETPPVSLAANDGRRTVSNMFNRIQGQPDSYDKKLVHPLL